MNMFDIPANCTTNETLLELLNEKNLTGYIRQPHQSGTPNANATTLDFNSSLCFYDKLPESEIKPFLQYETALAGYSVCIVGLVGLIGNVISIAVLSRKELRKSCFNQLLIALLTCDNLHIFFGIMEAYRLSFADFYPDFMHILFPYLWFPFYRISMVCSIYMIIAVAIERYWAVCFPHSYHNMAASQTNRFLYYVLPAVGASFIIGAPRFFETQYALEPTVADNCSFYEVPMVKPTDLRLNTTYIISYVHWIWTIATAVIPFTTLVILNGRIFFGLRRVQMNLNRHKTESRRSRSVPFIASRLSKTEGNPPEETIPLNEIRDNNENEANGGPSPMRSPGDDHQHNNHLEVPKENGKSSHTRSKSVRSATVSSAAQSREANMAVILICSVTMFILCHLPRIFVTIYEAANAELIVNCLHSKKGAIPNWFLYIPPVVKFLQVLNASINFPIYYTMGTAFRNSFHSMVGCGGNGR